MILPLSISVTYLNIFHQFEKNRFMKLLVLNIVSERCMINFFLLIIAKDTHVCKEIKMSGGIHSSGDSGDVI